MAIEVYNGLYSGQELDAAVTVVNAVIPSTATAQNKLATASDVSQLDTTVSGLVSDVADIHGDIDNILDDVSDLDTSVSTINSTITDIQGDITDIDGKIPSSASSQNQFATAADVGQVSGTVGNLSTSVSNIQAVIPSTATSSNKLATMADIPSGGSGIAGVQINGVDLTPDTNNKVDIPMSGSMVLGVIKTSQTYCTDIGTSGSNLTGELCASEVQYADYASLDDSAFIAKGTLDNVLDATIGDIQSIIQGVL